MWGGLCFKCSLKSFIFVYVERPSLGTKLHPAPSKYSECKWGLGVERGERDRTRGRAAEPKDLWSGKQGAEATECMTTICNERKDEKR